MRRLEFKTGFGQIDLPMLSSTTVQVPVYWDERKFAMIIRTHTESLIIYMMNRLRHKGEPYGIHTLRGEF